ncbi:MAG: HlyD family efflux transporter periplasmic adaptor subunit [Epsilonproteobacteria bacterium]|nr:HlyD family efflux transporter periplasmic adaptor subunit [Campylobacterota bacterium]
MKCLMTLLLLFMSSYAEVYYAKVEPIELKKISSNVTGEILDIDENLLGHKLHKEVFIKIDDTLDKAEYAQVKEKISYIQSIIDVNEKMLLNLEAMLQKKEQNYKRVEALKIKSQIEKDREFYDLVASRNQYLATKKEIANLKVQLADLSLREIQLRKILKDKNLTAKNYLLYSLNVSLGQVVTPGVLLAQVADISKAVLRFYVDASELENIMQKSVYIDGKKTKYKVSRVLQIADTKNISKYMVQVIIKAPKVFSKLVKIELKEK